LIVYIWTYMPTGICLVGSAQSSYTRILDYFSPLKLATETRLGMKFLSWYGFKNIRLSIIQLDPKIYSVKDMRTLEQYYIDFLYSVLNVIRSVSLARRNKINRIPYVNSSLRDKSLPIYVYDSIGSNLLYIFVSKTILYADFHISHKTLKLCLENGELYLGLFLLSTELLETASNENMLTLSELLELKNNYKKTEFLNSSNKIKARKITLTNIKNPKLSKTCRSVNSALLYIKKIEINGSKEGINKYINSGLLYKGHWKITE